MIFLGFFFVCSYVGLVEFGFEYFEIMFNYGIELRIEYYVFMVFFFGRVGKLIDVKEFIEKMFVKLAVIVWRSLFSVCWVIDDYELGVYVVEMVIFFDFIDSGFYILFLNIYVFKGMWVKVKEIRERMELNLVVKELGCSWIELNDEVRVFVSRDKFVFKIDWIFLVLDNLIKEMKGVGYVFDSVLILLDD